MSNLKRTIRNAVGQGISKGISDAVGKAVRDVVEPRATEYANKTAQRFDQAAGNAAQEARKATSGLEDAFANLERATQNYATQVSKNIKICPGCGQPTTAEKTSAPPAERNFRSRLCQRVLCAPVAASRTASAQNTARIAVPRFRLRLPRNRRRK